MVENTGRLALNLLCPRKGNHQGEIYTPAMKKLALDLRRLQIKDGMSQSYYRKEARSMMRRLKQTDENFKYFFIEFISLAKENVEIETLREAISELQRYVCLRINHEHPTSPGPDAIRNKIRCSKKRYFERPDSSY